MRVLIKRASGGKITLQESAKIAVVTVKRPAGKNALTSVMWSELAEIGRLIGTNRKNKVVVVRGSPGAFISGSDIKELHKLNVEQVNEAFGCMEEAISVFEQLPMPVIGVVDGPCMGAGFVLSLACDMRVGTKNTKMGIPVGRLGISLGPAFVRRIVRLLGPSRTKELVYTGKIYDYHEAKLAGLLNVLVEDAKELNDVVIKLAQLIASQSVAALRAVKTSVELCEWKQDIPWNYADSPDFYEGCLSFIEKRRPNF